LGVGGSSLSLSELRVGVVRTDVGCEYPTPNLFVKGGVRTADSRIPTDHAWDGPQMGGEYIFYGKNDGGIKVTVDQVTVTPRPPAHCM
jgi:hypothetical protein